MSQAKEFRIFRASEKERVVLVCIVYKRNGGRGSDMVFGA